MQAHSHSSEHLNWDGYQAWRGAEDGDWTLAEDQLVIQATAQRRLRVQLARAREVARLVGIPREPGHRDLPRLGTRWYLDLAIGFVLFATAFYSLALLTFEAATTGAGFPWRETVIGAQAMVIAALYVYARCARTTAVSLRASRRRFRQARR